MPAHAELAISALNAELERMRETQLALSAELAVRDGESRAARETLTKQEGDVARTREAWQKATESVSGMRRTLADADVAANEHRAFAAAEAEELRREIAVREAANAALANDLAAARQGVDAAESELDLLRAETAAQRDVIAGHHEAIGALRAHADQLETRAAAELRDLRDRLDARTNELSALGVASANKMGELVAVGLAQSETVAKLSAELGAVRVELVREVTQHGDTRRAAEAGDAVLARAQLELGAAAEAATQSRRELESAREQVWALERDLSASRQRNAEQDDRIAEIETASRSAKAAQDEAAFRAGSLETERARLLAELDLASAGRLQAATEAERLRARASGDATEITTLRRSLHVARTLLGDAHSDEPAPDHGMDTVVDAELGDLWALADRGKQAAAAQRDALQSAQRRADALAAEVSEARAEVAARDVIVSGLAADILSRDGERAGLESRIDGLVRQNDAQATAHGHLERRMATVSRSSSYRMGLAAAGVMRGLRRLRRRLLRGRANPLFDFGWYLGQNADVRWAGFDPYEHYLRYGYREARMPNRLFKPDWYLQQNPDVAAAGAEPLLHYWKHGAAEGRAPIEGFDPRLYLDRHPDAARSGRNPLRHYLAAPPDQAPQPGEVSILLVAWHCPTRAHAGGLRMLDLYDQLRRLAPGARIDLFTVRKPAVDWAYDDLASIFTNVYFTDHNDLSVKALNALRADRARYDVVDFQFLEAGHDVEAYRAVGRKLIFTPMELLSRAFHLERQSPGRLMTADRISEQMDIARRELALCRAVDEVVCVSKPDAAYLRSAAELPQVTALETGVSTLEFGALPLADDASRTSSTIVFVAYFGSPTNVEALDWYLREVHPRVKAAVPDYRFAVVGRGDLTKYAALNDPNIALVGEVESVGPHIARAALGISPALSGAGFRGKINQYATLGIATVASPIAAEGFAYRDGIDIFVAGDGEGFAAGCVRLLTDLDLNRRLSEAARETCLAHYSWASREGAIRSIYGVRKPHIAGAPVVTAIVPSYNHGQYIEKRILSILNQSYPNIDLIVIDDKSPDNSDAVIRSLRDRYGFTYIRREKNTGTPFSAWRYAAEEVKSEFIWICESDDFAEPDFAATGVDRLCQDAGAVLYYCNSHVVDSDGRVIGSTADYLRDNWQDARWERSFTAEGPSELADYQLRGMIVPNMSSAVIRASAFRKAWGGDLLKFRLTGDWLFIGRVLTMGRAVFDANAHSNFRKHAQTARERVKSAQSQAEFVMTKYRLHKLARKPARDLAVTLKTDATRFIYEPASAWQVFRAMMRISRLDTLRVGAALSWSMLFHREYWSKFRTRVKDQRRAGS